MEEEIQPGSNETEVAEPSESTEINEIENTSETHEPEEAEKPEVAEPEPEQRQDSETNKAFQEMRKKMESLEKEKQFARKYGQYGVFEESDIERLYGSKGIHSVSDLDKAIENERREKERQEWIDQGLDVDMVDKYLQQKLENHPDVIKGRQAAYDSMLVNSFDEVKRSYPDMVKSPEDIPTEVWQRFNNGQNGVSLAEAFLLVRNKEIVEREQAKIRQAALNNGASKNHIRANGSDGAGTDMTQIPDEVLNQYRRLFKGTGKTDKDFIAHYKKSLGG